jgi:hypothetical protein
MRACDACPFHKTDFRPGKAVGTQGPVNTAERLLPAGVRSASSRSSGAPRRRRRAPGPAREVERLLEDEPDALGDAALGLDSGAWILTVNPAALVSTSAGRPAAATGARDTAV